MRNTINPNSGIVQIKGKQYQTIAYRLKEFREKYPIDSGWSIETECIVFTDEKVIFKAHIKSPDKKVVATGHAEEIRDRTPINRTSALENAETSAIGRALAAAGFVGSHFASADEVIIAQQVAKRNGNGNGNGNGQHPRPLELPDISQANWESKAVPKQLLPRADRDRNITWGDLIFDLVKIKGRERLFSGAQYLHMLESWQNGLAQNPEVQKVIHAALAMRKQSKIESQVVSTV